VNRAAHGSCGLRRFHAPAAQARPVSHQLAKEPILRGGAIHRSDRESTVSILIFQPLSRGILLGQCGYQESLSDDARYLGTVKVEYLFHPLFGQAVRDVRCDAKGRTEGQLLVDTSQGRQCVPVWMTDPRRCAPLTFGLQPFASEQALCLLGALLASLDGRDLPPKLDS